MVRSPAVEIINCIKESDLEQPTVRLVNLHPNCEGILLALVFVSLLVIST